VVDGRREIVTPRQPRAVSVSRVRFCVTATVTVTAYVTVGT